MLTKTEILKNKISQLLKLPAEEIQISIFDNSSNVVMTLDEFYSNFNTEAIQKGQCQLEFKIDHGRDYPIASVTLKDQIGCAGIVILSDLFVNKKFRQLGLGTLICEFLQEFSIRYGYGVLQCTDRTDNLATERIAKKLGWVTMNVFINPKSKNQIIVWYKNLI